MKILYKKYKEIINYLIFGLFTTLINLLVKFVLLFIFFDASNSIQLQLTVIISWLLSILFAYFTNRKFVFRSINKNKLKEFINFIIARLSTLFLEMTIMWFFVTLLKLNSDFDVIMFTLIVQILIIISNYIFSKLFVFKKTDK